MADSRSRPGSTRAAACCRRIRLPLACDASYQARRGGSGIGAGPLRSKKNIPLDLPSKGDLLRKAVSDGVAGQGWRAADNGQGTAGKSA